MEAAGAHLRHKHVDRPEWAKAGQAQTPSCDQEQNKAMVGKNSVKNSSFCNQEISTHCYKAEGDDGDRVGEEEEQSKDLAPELTTAPSKVQVGVNRDGLQDGAVQQVSHRQVNNEHVEASPEMGVEGEGQDCHEVPHGTTDGYCTSPQHGEVTVLYH